MSRKSPLTILVAGATGRQGGALSRALLAKGHKVRALTRHPDGAAAQVLRGLGADAVAGDFGDRASLDRAMQGVDAVFAMTTPFEQGASAETRQGLALIDAAKGARVRHLVYSSIASADRNTQIAHFESKHRVEQHLAASDVPYTILAPVCFMETALALPAGRTVQRIAVTNLADFGALVLEGRDGFLGRRIELASDELSRAEAEEILGRGVAPEQLELSPILTAQAEAMRADRARLLEWLDRTGFRVDVAGLRRTYPVIGWLSFRDWVRTQSLAASPPTVLEG
jgi:uncharacterized protein YbjT (DUF2867 family)